MKQDFWINNTLYIYIYINEWISWSLQICHIYEGPKSMHAWSDVLNHPQFPCSLWKMETTPWLKLLGKDHFNNIKLIYEKEFLIHMIWSNVLHSLWRLRIHAQSRCWSILRHHFLPKRTKTTILCECSCREKSIKHVKVVYWNLILCHRLTCTS